MDKKRKPAAPRQPPVPRIDILNIIRRTLDAMPGYANEADLVLESTTASREEVEYIESIAIRDKWPLRLGYLMYNPGDTWGDIIDQFDLSDD